MLNQLEIKDPFGDNYSDTEIEKFYDKAVMEFEKVFQPTK